MENTFFSIWSAKNLGPTEINYSTVHLRRDKKKKKHLKNKITNIAVVLESFFYTWKYLDQKNEMDNLNLVFMCTKREILNIYIKHKSIQVRSKDETFLINSCQEIPEHFIYTVLFCWLKANTSAFLCWRSFKITHYHSKTFPWSVN